MKRLMLLVSMVALVMGLTGCPKTIVRDEVTYKTGVKFKLKLELALAASLETWIKSDCKCKDGKFVTEQCRKDADNVLVAKARSQWHADMDMHNAGVLEKRPDKTPPVIPAAETLCPKKAPAPAPATVEAKPVEPVTPATTPAVKPGTVTPVVTPVTTPKPVTKPATPAGGAK